MRAETIAEQLMYTTVYLHGQAGEKEWSGTGFIYEVPTEQGRAHFVVTNKHVLDNAEALTIRMVRADPSGQPMQAATEVTLYDFSPRYVTGHPDPKVDVAVIPVAIVLKDMQSRGAQPFFRSLGSRSCLTLEGEADFDALEDITFIGYPSGIYDIHNCLPIARRGVTATPISVNFRGVPAFLVDASVYPGSSGSPVFVFNRGTYSNREGAVSIGSRALCVGILAAVHVRQVEGTVTALPARLIASFDEPIGLGIVYKAWLFDDCVNAVLDARGIRRLPEPESPGPGELTEADDALKDDDAN